MHLTIMNYKINMNPLKVKDWLKERSEKQFLIHSTEPKGVIRLKDDYHFWEKQFVGFEGNRYRITGFSNDNIKVYLEAGSAIGVVEINDLNYNIT